jgi:hypothetical protein
MDFAVLVLNLIALVAATTCTGNLKADEYYNLTNSSELVLTYFYAEGHTACEGIATTLDQVSRQFSNVTFSQVDCPHEPKLCDDLEIFVTPQIWLSRGTQGSIQFTGEFKTSALVGFLFLRPLKIMLTMSRIVSFIGRQFGDAVKRVLGTDYQIFTNSKETVIMAYLAADDDRSLEKYSKVAEGLQGQYLFGYTNELAQAVSEGVSQPGLIFFDSPNNRRGIFAGDFTTNALFSFIELQSQPLIGELEPVAYKRYVEVDSRNICLRFKIS